MTTASQPVASSSPRFPARPWTLSVTGLPSRGPLDDLERTMRDTGFDLDSGGCFFDLCFGPTSMPYSIRGRPFRDSWTAGINRRILRRLGASVTGGRTLIGWTIGRQRGTGAYLEIETEMTHVAPLVTFTPTPGVRVGAGPAVFSTTFARTGPGGTQPLDTTRQPGLLAEASLTFPRRSRVFVEVSAQQRWLGRPVCLSWHQHTDRPDVVGIPAAPTRDRYDARVSRQRRRGGHRLAGDL